MKDFFIDEDFPCNQVEFENRFNTEQELWGRSSLYKFSKSQNRFIACTYIFKNVPHVLKGEADSYSRENLSLLMLIWRLIRETTRAKIGMRYCNRMRLVGFIFFQSFVYSAGNSNMNQYAAFSNLSTRPSLSILISMTGWLT
jgi:hypothetical protein